MVVTGKRYYVTEPNVREMVVGALERNKANESVNFVFNSRQI